MSDDVYVHIPAGIIISSEVLKGHPWRIQRGGGKGAAAFPIGLYFLKAAFFRVKGIYFVVCICDK